jgi:hypothetical protein
VSQPLPQSELGLPIPERQAQNAEARAAEEEAGDTSSASRPSAIDNLQSEPVALSEQDGDLLLAAAVFLVRYGPQGERALARGLRRIKAL